MFKFIKTATKEFEQNGRSDRFVAMEDYIISKGKPLQIFYFAKYAKGANIEKLQTAIDNCGDLLERFCFMVNVLNATPRPEILEKLKTFSTKVPTIIQDEDESCGKKYQYVLKKTTDFNIDNIITVANKEFEKNGRSQTFLQYERLVLFSQGSAYQLLFCQFVKGVHLTLFEKSIIMSGDALNMYLFALYVKDSNKQNLLQAAHLCELDYHEIDKEQAKREKVIIEATQKLKSAKRSKNNGDKIKGLEDTLLRLLSKKTYLEQVKEYEANIRAIINGTHI